MSKKIRVLCLLGALTLPLNLFAQTDLAAQTLGRGYWHVFAAYAIVWVFMFGWLIKIGRQLARVERKLDASEG